MRLYSQRSPLRGVVCSVLAFLIIPNVPFWIAGNFVQIVPRGLFNVDYLLIGMLALVLPSWIAATLFASIFVMDVLWCTSCLYFFSWSESVSAARYIALVPWFRIVTIGGTAVAVGCCVGALSWALSSKREFARQSGIALLGTFVALSLVGLYTGPARGRDSFRFPKVCTSSLFRAKRVFTGTHASDLAVVKGTSASTSLHLLQPTKLTEKRRNVVFVLVESFGLLECEVQRKALEEEFSTPSITSRYQVMHGTTDFYGSTVSGELRELCGLKAGLHQTTEIDQFSSDCIPRRMQSLGYHTEAYHGFYGMMFDRVRWYKQLGFEQQNFLEQFRDLKQCQGAFNGACDEAVAEVIHSRLADTSQPQFLYWVTLDSHLPVNADSSARREFRCDALGSDDAISMCVWRGMIKRTLHSIATIAADPNLRSTEFVIVGDHAPPFTSRNLRLQFSQSQVPYMELVPRESYGPQRRAAEPPERKRGSSTEITMNHRAASIAPASSAAGL